MKCWNDKCQNDPSDTAREIVVNCDGDSVCNSECEQEYEKQKAHFFNVTVYSSKKCNDYLRGN